jgi:hypothetical protein
VTNFSGGWYKQYSTRPRLALLRQKSKIICQALLLPAIFLVAFILVSTCLPAVKLVWYGIPILACLSLLIFLASMASLFQESKAFAKYSCMLDEKPQCDEGDPYCGFRIDDPTVKALQLPRYKDSNSCRKRASTRITIITKSEFGRPKTSTSCDGFESARHSCDENERTRSWPKLDGSHPDSTVCTQCLQGSSTTARGRVIAHWPSIYFGNYT